MNERLRAMQEAARLLHDEGIIGPNEYRKVLDRTKDWYELQEEQAEPPKEVPYSLRVLDDPSRAKTGLGRI